MLAEQDAELGQLRQAIEQLQEDKTKETGRADRLAEELNGEYFLVRVTIEVVPCLMGPCNACRLPSEGQGTI